MSEFLLSDHARRRMERRRILPEWVDRAMLPPDVVEEDPVDPTLEHRLATIPERGNRVLRVVCTVQAPERIVTMFFDSKAKPEP